MSDQPAVICERTFQTVVGGIAKPIRVAWMRPVPDGTDWSCEYVIEWPDRAWRSRRAMGVDSTQALLLAMQRVSAELYTAEPSVFWWEPDDVLHLPVMSVVVDLEAARTKGRLPDET